MEIDGPEARAYLYELYTQTQGDIEKQVSMYDVGASTGLEKTEAGTMAESLFIQGLAELKTLSGGISITEQGLDALDINIPAASNDDGYQLSCSRLLEDKGKKAIEQVICEIKDHIGQKAVSYDRLEEIVVDIKTLEVQMLSPNPKTGVLIELFKSLLNNLTDKLPAALKKKINILLS